MRQWLSDDASTRLIDAALGVVRSVRVLVDVGEEVLLEQRDRLDTETVERRRHWMQDPEDGAGGPPPQDIPVE